ncbi:hypothetical protein KI387_030643, partial [Taxus chinensis]
HCGHIGQHQSQQQDTPPFQLAYGIDPVLPIEFDIPTVRVMKNERMDESDL